MTRPAPHQDLQPIDFVKEAMILTLWNSRFDTHDIARKIGCREFQVYNLLSRMAEGKR
jgi:hypothetical protein